MKPEDKVNVALDTVDVVTAKFQKEDLCDSRLTNHLSETVAP